MRSDMTPVHRVVIDDAAIWRYMDLSKFVSMLDRRGLWFTEAATFHDDPWEGFCKPAHREMPPGNSGPVVRENVEGRISMSGAQMIADLSRRSAGICENARDHLYVNSVARMRVDGDVADLRFP